MPITCSIVDAHHHLWDLKENYYPWLTDKIGPRIFGDDYADIRKDYTVEKFIDDHDDLPVAASVHVQAEIDPASAERETDWLTGVCKGVASKGFPQAIVAFAPLSDPALPAILERQASYQNVRGVRQTLHHRPELLEDPAWRRGIALLRQYGLSFDLQIYPRQTESALDVVNSNPETAFIVCHAGLPADRSEAGLLAWRRAIQSLAKRDNVSCKISGLGMFNRSWTVADIRPTVLDVIEAFGTNRTMFGSNFPVDRLASSYRAIWDAYDLITTDFSEAEREALFGDSARRAYRLPKP